ncbi:GNAT family N-acetyltransferase [Streptomyces sp. NPDC046977]|uniref:GNAT family N-acetyltransferase n=1 Tax=Streptomyces sp. NPDC046977 TaxID=3154703 RepID=UPI00340959F7
MNTLVPPSVAEQSEAEALFRFETAAPEPIRTALGLNATRIGGGVVLSMRNDPTRYWSKALGFGVTGPVTAGLIREVCDFYRAEGTPQAVLQIAPAFLPEDWEAICESEGITAGSSWVKLVAATEDVVARADALEQSPTGITVAPVGAGDAAEWGSVLVRAFGMPEEHYAQLSAYSAAQPGWHPFAAWLDGEIVGTGTMYADGDTAQFFAGGVLPHARNRGGQTALLAARARAARDLGCRFLVAETGAETPGTRNPSLHNMVRLGFRVAYERRNWNWQPLPEAA